MATNEEQFRVREVVGVFGDENSLQEAIDDLMTSGFDRAEISLLASEKAVVDKLGRKYDKVEEMEDDPMAPRTGYFGAESIGEAQGALMAALVYFGAMIAGGVVLASGDDLASVIAGAVLGAGGGGLIGVVLSRFLGAKRSRRVREQLRHGGLLLWVRAWDAEREKKAMRIMSAHAGRDVHAHMA